MELLRAAMRRDPVQVAESGNAGPDQEEGWAKDPEQKRTLSYESRDGSDGTSENKVGGFMESVEMVSRGKWIRTDSHSVCLECSLNQAGRRPTLPLHFLKSHSTLPFLGHCPHCLSLWFFEYVHPSPSINSLKASPSFTHLCTPFSVHTQSLAQCLAYNHSNKYLSDGLWKHYRLWFPIGSNKTWSKIL